MFVRRVLVGSSGLGIVGTGLWFLISHIKETRNRNWANGLLISVSEEKLTSVSNKEINKVWDLDVVKWDSAWFTEVWEKDKSQTNNIDIKAHFGSWEEARLAFFTQLEEFKKNNKLQDAFDPTNGEANWNIGDKKGLSEFLKVVSSQKTK